MHRINWSNCYRILRLKRCLPLLIRMFRTVETSKMIITLVHWKRKDVKNLILVTTFPYFRLLSHLYSSRHKIFLQDIRKHSVSSVWIHKDIKSSMMNGKFHKKQMKLAKLLLKQNKKFLSKVSSTISLLSRQKLLPSMKSLIIIKKTYVRSATVIYFLRIVLLQQL